MAPTTLVVVVTLTAAVAQRDSFAAVLWLPAEVMNGPIPKLLGNKNIYIMKRVNIRPRFTKFKLKIKIIIM